MRRAPLPCLTNIALAYHEGEWEESARLLGDFMSEIGGTQETWNSWHVTFRCECTSLAARSRPRSRTARELELVRAIADPQALCMGWRDGGLRGMTAALDVAWVLRGTGREGELLELIAATDVPPRWFEAAGAILEGDLVRAADVCAEIGSLPADVHATSSSRGARLRRSSSRRQPGAAASASLLALGRRDGLRPRGRGAVRRHRLSLSGREESNGRCRL